MGPPSFCPSCGAVNAAAARFCATCGAALTQPAAATPERASLRLPALRGKSEPEQPLRALTFALGRALLMRERAAESVPLLERALREEGAAPDDAEIRLALAHAALALERADDAARQLLEAALVAGAPRRGEILDYLSRTLSRSSAVAHGRWLIDDWWPRMRAHGGDDATRVLGILVRAQLHLGLTDAALETVAAAASADPTGTHDELERLLAADPPLPALSGSGGEGAALSARLFVAAGARDRALAVLDLAIATPGPNHADAPLHALRGQWLLAAGQRDEAAASLARAGNRYLWRDEAVQAAHWLEQSLQIDPSNVDGHWSLADALQIASFAPGLKPAERAAYVARARAAWEAGYAQRRPGTGDAWAYAVRAFIAVREAELALHPQREGALWEAVTLIERALLLDPKQAGRWGNLSTFHRGLMNQQAAVAAALHGHELDPRNANPLTEAVIVFTNTGRWERANAELVRLEAIERTPWSTFVAARLHLYQGQPAEALARIDEALQGDSRNLGYQHTKGMALRALGRPAESRAIAEAIVRERFDLDERDSLTYLGWSALECGDLERALQAFDADLQQAADPFAIESSERYLALAHLARGEVERARSLLDHALDKPLDAESRWLLLNDLRDFAALPLALGMRERELLDAFARRVQSAPLASAADARAELEAALGCDADQTPPWSRIGALASLARMDGEDERPAAAADRYSELAERFSMQFPEASIGLDAALAKLRRLTTMTEYWALRDQAPAAGSWQRRLVDSYLDTAYRLGSESGETATMAGVVTPIVVEMDASLVPAGNEAEWPILKTWLPEMRQRIEAECGVKVPGTRLREDNGGWLAPDRAMVMLADVPRVTVRLPHGAAYALAPADKASALGIEVLQPETDPLTRQPACWVPAGSTDALRAAGFGVIADAHEVLVRHLEAQLRRNLADFVGVDEVIALLGEWKPRLAQDATLGAALDRLLADDEQLLRLTRVLRRLVRERVPIIDGAAIVEVFLADDSANPLALLRQLRPRLLAARVQAIEPTARRVLPAGAERECADWLVERDGRTVLAMTAEAAQSLLGEVRTLLGDDEPRTVLVVRSALLRPHLRDLLELEFPDLEVFAAAELGPDEAPANAGEAAR